MKLVLFHPPLPGVAEPISEGDVEVPDVEEADGEEPDTEDNPVEEYKRILKAVHAHKR